MVFAVSSDKQVEEILGVLAGYFDEFHLTKYGNNPRSVEPAKLAALLKIIAPGKPAAIHASSVEAWRVARSRTEPSDLLCVAGSVFLAGELRPVVAASFPFGKI